MRIYLAHPVRSVLVLPDGRDLLITRVGEWLRHFRQHYPVMDVECPWLADVLAFEDRPELVSHEDGIRAMLRTLDRYDGIALCGGRYSSGILVSSEMLLEGRHVYRNGGLVIDFTQGVLQPTFYRRDDEADFQWPQPLRGLSKYWVGWDGPKDVSFVTTWPWWMTGQTSNDNNTFCAVVIACDPMDAWAAVRGWYPPDYISTLNRRFVTKKPVSWSPFTERFPRAAWMEWPDDFGDGDG